MNGFGERLRDARQQAGMSLRELARESDVSPSFISQIENGKAQPSVATIYGIARALDIAVNELFDEDDAAPDAPDGLEAGRDPLEAWAPNESASRISRIHPDHRAHIQIDEGITWERLSATPEAGMVFMRIIYAPGAGRDLVSHPGYEYGYVLTGTLEVTVGVEVFNLRPGEAVGFDSTIPHMLRNIGDDVCEGVWFVHKNRPRGAR